MAFLIPMVMVTVFVLDLTARTTSQRQKNSYKKLCNIVALNTLKCSINRGKNRKKETGEQELEEPEDSQKDDNKQDNWEQENNQKNHPEQEHKGQENRTQKDRELEKRK